MGFKITSFHLKIEKNSFLHLGQKQDWIKHWLWLQKSLLQFL